MAQFFVSEWQKTETQTSILPDLFPSIHPSRLPSFRSEILPSRSPSFRPYRRPDFLCLFLSDILSSSLPFGRPYKRLSFLLPFLFFWSYFFINFCLQFIGIGLPSFLPSFTEDFLSSFIIFQSFLSFCSLSPYFLPFKLLDFFFFLSVIVVFLSFHLSVCPKHFCCLFFLFGFCLNFRSEGLFFNGRRKRSTR